MIVFGHITKKTNKLELKVGLCHFAIRNLDFTPADLFIIDLEEPDVKTTTSTIMHDIFTAYTTI